MARKIDRTLLSYCPDLQVMDCTLRDGGLVNNFAFSDEFVKDLYHANIAAGVDYMEFGYKASKNIFNENDFGKWKFCNEEDIRNIVGDNHSPMKISVMADTGRTDYKTDIGPKSDSVVDLYRIATYIHQLPTAIDMIEDIHEKGYETSVNIMAVSKVNDRDIMGALELLSKTNVDCIYVVDSFGSFYPEQIADLTDRYSEIAGKYGKLVGFHGHNNQQLAFANTIESLRYGASILDATVCGMGRGAGNCYLESLLGFLKNPKYKLVPMMQFIEKHMTEMKKEYFWGFDLPYLMTGILNAHPSSAINFEKAKRKDYTNFYHELLDIE
ncbi:MAG: aldolase catalytic domain-containing protein [Lachnospiraceae bacterium]